MPLSIIDKWGKKRKAAWIICPTCLKRKLIRTYSNRPNKFCSVICYNKSMITAQNRNCGWCRKKITVKVSKLLAINFCGRECKERLQSGENHPKWVNGYGTYRRRTIEKYGYNCISGVNCPLMGIKLPKFAFDVDHKDGNRKNNKLENLQVLCILCHRKKTMNKATQFYQKRIKKGN